ncbi:MAG: hypothetical protein RL198_788 [Actinomycetota bacterium]|jgi:Flp pilus assembly protein TadG
MSPASMRKRASVGKRGAVAVELALTLPIVILLLFGLLDFGRFFYAQMVVESAATEAARTASLRSLKAFPTIDSQLQQLVADWAEPARVAGSFGGGQLSSTRQLCSGNIGANQYAVITVCVPFTPLLPINIASNSSCPIQQSVAAQGVFLCQG